MSRIFVSYRREDSPDAAQTICDKLSDHFGKESVFFDIDTIPAGVDFRNHINTALNTCQVMLAVVGKGWAGTGKCEGTTRLQDSNDFVRIELETALLRAIPVIPVLVGGAMMPDETMLPPTLRQFVYRNAVEVRHGLDRGAHLERLTKAIERHFGEAPPPSTVDFDEYEAQKLLTEGRRVWPFVKDHYEARFGIWEEKAEKGNATCQFLLGVCFENGLGVEKSASRAFRWFEEAADQGFAAAQLALSEYYRTGDGVEKDAGKATDWLLAAAAAGLTRAQFELGVNYYGGYGVRKDRVEAMKWLREAARKGSPPAQFMVACEDNADPNESVRKAIGAAEWGQSYAVDWLRDAAAQGDREARRYLQEKAKPTVLILWPGILLMSLVFSGLFGFLGNGLFGFLGSLVGASIGVAAGGIWWGVYTGLWRYLALIINDGVARLRQR